MKKEYEVCKAVVVFISATDVIASSGDPDKPLEMPEVPV